MYLFIHFTSQYHCPLFPQSPLMHILPPFPLPFSSEKEASQGIILPTHIHTSSHRRTRCIVSHCQAILYNSSRKIVRFSRHSVSLTLSSVFRTIWRRQRSTHKKPIAGGCLCSPVVTFTSALFFLQQAQCGLDLRHITVVELVGVFPTLIGRIRAKIMPPALALQLR